MSFVCISPSVSLVNLKTSTSTLAEIAATNQPINENWWVPDLSTEQDLGHAHGDQSARALEVTGFSKSPPSHSISRSYSEKEHKTSSLFPEFAGFSHIDSVSELGNKSGEAFYEENNIENTQIVSSDFEKAKQQMSIAKDKVSQLREELKSREQQHESMAQQLQDELRIQEESYSNRNAQLTKEFEKYKIESKEEKNLLRDEIDMREREIKKTTEDRQNSLRDEIRGLETNLGTVRSEVERAKMKAASITIQRDELKKTLIEMKERYNEDSKEWESLLAQEQISWKKEKQGVDQVMQQLMNEHSERLNQAHNGARAKAEEIRSELRNQFFEKEVLLQKTEVALKLTELEEKDLEAKVNQMEREKDDLVSLGRRSISVLRKGFLDVVARKDKSV